MRKKGPLFLYSNPNIKLALVPQTKKMDTESLEVLNGLVMRWKVKAEQWQTSSEQQRDNDKLDSDIEMLVRHVEGLHCIKNTLSELESIRITLVGIRGTTKPQEAPTTADKELMAIEQEMRKMNCHNEEFLVKYMLVKDDYRTPTEALPLPYGFKCHKQYKLELDLLKVRMQNAVRQAEAQREQLRSNTALWTGPEFLSITTDINQCMNSHHSLQLSLYHLLMHVQPVNTAVFHAKCSELIDRRMKCLEAKRLDQLQDIVNASALVGSCCCSMNACINKDDA